MRVFASSRYGRNAPVITTPRRLTTVGLENENQNENAY
jgi:hypothetical protein